MKEISIKIKTVKVGWVRETVHRRGKKFVYGYWRKPRKLLADWTIEPVQDMVMVMDYEAFDNMLKEQFSTMTQDEYEKYLAGVYEDSLANAEDRDALWQEILQTNAHYRNDTP